jgi:hypothetical protein
MRATLRQLIRNRAATALWALRATIQVVWSSNSRVNLAPCRA